MIVCVFILHMTYILLWYDITHMWTISWTISLTISWLCMCLYYIWLTKYSEMTQSKHKPFHQPFHWPFHFTTLCLPYYYYSIIFMSVPQPVTRVAWYSYRMTLIITNKRCTQLSRYINPSHPPILSITWAYGLSNESREHCTLYTLYNICSYTSQYCCYIVYIYVHIHDVHVIFFYDVRSFQFCSKSGKFQFCSVYVQNL